MRSRVLAVSLGALALSGAYATYSSTSGSSRLDLSESPQRNTRVSAREIRDSVVAQLLADREGPRVDIRAQLVQYTGSRRLRASFRVEDDAYVVIGHVDAEGVVRIVFPAEPRDDGFVKGGRSYQSSEFFAGFADAYRFRARSYGSFAAYRPESYDGQFGYLFIVASWRPMHTEQFANDHGWDSFEITDNSYQDDPRAAIYELAALLAGENREAYTVKFARYSNTMDYSPFGFGRAAFTSGLCTTGANGWRFYGFPGTFRPLDLVGRPGYNDVVYSRGRTYYYDSLGDCYTSAPYGGYYPYFQPRIAQTPPDIPPSGIPTRGRAMSADDSPRNPIEPKPPVGSGRVGPILAKEIGPIDVPTSPQYRDRGLITEDDGSRPPVRSPRVAVQPEQPERRTRPSIQQMTERRTREAADESSYRPTPRARVQANDGWSAPAPDPRQRVREPSNSANEGRPMSRPSASDSPRSEPMAPRPAVESRPVAPPPTPPPSTPPPSTPRSEPASAGSSIRPIVPR
jgi:hypothetical protein